MLMRLLGLALIAAGVWALWTGGVDYREKEKLIDLGPIQATADRVKTIEIPKPVGAGLVGAGSLLLLIAGLGGRKR